VPKYAFECEPCSLRFERTLRGDEYKTYPCPSCRGAAPLILSTFGFAFAPTKGAAANSGVHDHDYPSADKAVGRSAADRWEHLHAREEVKKQAREQGQTHALIRRTGKDYVDYEPMSDAGREARRSLARDAIMRLRRERK
jgi:putative FmdB family regulatory protein